MDDNNNVTPLVCYHYLLIGATIKRQVLGHAKKLLTTSTVISTTVALDYNNTSFVTHEERDGKKNFFVFRWFLSSDTRTQRCSAAREKSSAVAAATLLCRFHLPRGLPSLGFFSAAALSILVAPRSFGRATERFRKLRASPTIIIPLSWHFLSWEKEKSLARRTIRYSILIFFKPVALRCAESSRRARTTTNEYGCATRAVRKSDPSAQIEMNWTRLQTSAGAERGGKKNEIQTWMIGLTKG